MSLQLALSAALSGLRTSQQQAALVSHNLANATTAGYVRRDLELAATVTAGQGGGVAVEGVARRVDELLIRDARFTQSQYTAQTARASSLADYAQVIGQPQDERSVSTELSQLRQAFERLHGMPDDDAAQSAVVGQATALAQSLNSAATAAQTVQADARDRLRESVDTVNAALTRIGDLNGTIARMEAVGGDAGDLRDERDRLLDRVSEEIGIRAYTRDDGQVVVMTRNGQTLLDGALPPGDQPLEIVGDAVMANGVALSDNPERDIQSGRIMGYVQIAGQDMPRVLEQLDALAAALVEGFEGAEADPDQPGLFVLGTGSGGAAARIAVNPAVTAEPWRVQSGVQAAAPLDPGDQTQIAAFAAVFTSPVGFTAPGLPSSATVGDYATALVSAQQGYRTTAEAEMASRKIAADTLQTARVNRDGVNMDDEMQKLLLIEQSYAASAQVIQTAGRMIDILLQLRG